MELAALLIDYENIHWSLKRQYGQAPEPRRIIGALRGYAERHGNPCLSRAYADFGNPEFRGLMSVLQRYGIEPRHVVSKTYEDGRRKNAADIEMSLEALEMAYDRPDVSVFTLASGDRDMIQIARKLRARGRRVYAVGVERAMSTDLAAAADGFTAIESLTGMPPAGGTPAPWYDGERIARRLCELELTLPFVGLKYFMRVLSGGGSIDARVYDAVNRAIAGGLIRTYQIANPGGGFPVTACRVNPDHPVARMAFRPPAAAV